MSLPEKPPGGPNSLNGSMSALNAAEAKMKGLVDELNNGNFIGQARLDKMQEFLLARSNWIKMSIQIAEPKPGEGGTLN